MLEASRRPEGLHDSLPDNPVWPGLMTAICQCILFYSRLPCPDFSKTGSPHALPDFRVVPRGLPLASLFITAPAAAVIWLCLSLGLDSTLSAALAVTTMVLSTGAFHEDGLADSADGLFGGQTVARRLEIMKDSRVGSYGASALVLSLLLRVTALAAIGDLAGPTGAAVAIMANGGWSRALGIAALAASPHARTNGTAAMVGVPTLATTIIALGSAAMIAAATLMFAGLQAAAIPTALLFSTMCGLGVAHLARRMIGGQTGDTAGAVQQLAEIGFYIGVALALSQAHGNTGA